MKILALVAFALLALSPSPLASQAADGASFPLRRMTRLAEGPHGAGMLGALQGPGRETQRGMMGVYLAEDRERSLVEGLVRGGPAAKAGLLVGDLILAVDGRPVGGFEDLGRALASRVPGEHVVVAVEREGWRREFELVLAPARGLELGGPEGGSLRRVPGGEERADAREADPPAAAPSPAEPRLLGARRPRMAPGAAQRILPLDREALGEGLRARLRAFRDASGRPGELKVLIRGESGGEWRELEPGVDAYVLDEDGEPRRIEVRVERSPGGEGERKAGERRALQLGRPDGERVWTLWMSPQNVERARILQLGKGEAVLELPRERRDPHDGGAVELEQMRAELDRLREELREVRQSLRRMRAEGGE